MSDKDRKMWEAGVKATAKIFDLWGLETQERADIMGIVLLDDDGKPIPHGGKKDKDEST